MNEFNEATARTNETEDVAVEVEVAWEDVSDELRDRLQEAFRTIYDPEIPVNIYDLGLIYAVRMDPSGLAEITMTLTAPGCPVAGPLVSEVESKALMVPGVSLAKVDLVFDPPWTLERMSEAARLQLGMY